MAHKQQINTEFSARFFSHIEHLDPSSLRQYRCTEISDIHYCQLGVLRCLSGATTGHEFLQLHADQGLADIDPGHFFKALKSPRRLTNITSLNDLLAGPMISEIPNPYAKCAELSDWDLYAVDGHYQKAACFDPKTESSFGELRAIATGHFFQMDMRSNHMSCLGMSNPEDGKKKAHDMTVIKRSTADQLRNGAPKGRKVMLVWNKACIDYRHWFKLKHTYGIYFVTLEKSNSTAETCAINLIDGEDPRNNGVISDHMVSTSTGVMLRRIVYTNPEDGVTYTYLTSDFTLPAYQIVLLYKHRWDIEKIFHQFKSKMKERKSWASSLSAKQAHAIFECLTHNLYLLFEQSIVRTEGIRDELEEATKVGRARTKAALRAASESGIIRCAGNFINTAVQRATQRTFRFVRWVGNLIYQQVPWVVTMARLKVLWRSSAI